MPHNPEDPPRGVHIGGDGVSLDSELTLMSLRELSFGVGTLPPDQQSQTALNSAGALLLLGEIVGPRLREIVDWMHRHPADEADKNDPMFARVKGLLAWLGQLEPVTIVSMTLSTAALLELIRVAGLDIDNEEIQRMLRG